MAARSTRCRSGPYNVTGPGDSPSRQRIFVCKPAIAAEEEPCARKILSTLGRRAFRRPFAAADLTPLLAFYREGRGDGRNHGTFDRGIEMALRAMLVSPNFLFRIERDPVSAARGSVYKITDIELASRLSFFLWSSIPDEHPLALAEQGKLRDPDELQRQVKRMLSDPKSNALVRNFTGQWLLLRNIDQIKPDVEQFPAFDESLRRAFRQETEMLFDWILRQNRPVTEILDANYTFLNERLAEFYGISRVYGPRFRQVQLTDPNRGGLFGQGSILTATSYPTRTSVVLHTLLLYGAGIRDGNAHDHVDLPLLLAGGKSAGVKSGRHLRVSKETPMTNLLLTMLDRAGVRIETLGDSTGRMDQLAGI